MGKVESAQGPLRGIYRLVTDNYPDLYYNLRLRITVKALNDTAGHKRLVLSLLVWTIPSLGNAGTGLPIRSKYSEPLTPHAKKQQP